MNKLIIFSAPSGSGKTTIVRAIMKEFPKLEFSVSACSRSPRNKEIHGKDYYFVDIDEFKRLINENQFIEWEEVYKDNYYGTLLSETDKIWERGHIAVFDVDVVGGLNIKKKFPDNSLAIFIEAPSVQKLEERLRKRKTENEEEIQKRIGKAAKEMKFANKFDKIIINDSLEKAISETKAIVKEFLKNGK